MTAREIEIGWLGMDEALQLGLADLIALHWDEVALDKLAVPLAVDWAKYRQLDRAGVLRGVGLKRRGKLVGYNVFFVQPTLHYSTSLWALNDVLYLDPDERRGMAGARLVKQAERLLAEVGVKKIIYHTKLHLRSLGRDPEHGTVGDLLSRLGYTHVENVYAKMI